MPFIYFYFTEHFMKNIRMKFMITVKRCLLLKLITLTTVQMVLTGCGGGGSDTPTTQGSSLISVASSSSAVSSSNVAVSSSSSLANSLASSSSLVSSVAQTSSSSAKSSAASSAASTFVDVSNQFTLPITENFYVFQNPAEPGVLRYLPKRLALTGMPGIASVQRTNKVSTLLKLFLDLSETDWTSTTQVTFSSKFTLDVDTQKLKQESEALGYTGLADLKVKPPLTAFEQRYATNVPPARIQIQCKNLTLLINGDEATLHDCNLMDTDGVIATQTINNVGGFKYESLSFDPDAIAGNKSLRGTFNVDYTLPGTHEFDRLLATNNGNLEYTWQLNFTWPLAQTSVSSTALAVNWKTLLAELKTLVSAGQTHWNEDAINSFAASAINSGFIGLQSTTTLTPALKLSLVNYLKQELFVAIYSENGSAPLMWAPKLRFKNVDLVSSQQVVLRYFDSDLLLTSKVNSSCLTTPDVQNNIYKSSNCVNSNE